MKFLKRFNENVDFSIYHNITDEDISDLCLELTDVGFTLDISKYFISNGKRTSEPISRECYPIYDLTLDRSDRKEDIDGNRFNGTYYYQEMDILTGFKSIVNKMTKLLPTYKVYYTISNTTYHIRLVLSKINLDQIGFDFHLFSEELFRLCEEISNESPNRYVDRDMQFSGSAGGKLYFTFMTDGNNLKDDSFFKKFKEVDEIDNKDLYVPIEKKIDEFLKPYNKFINVKKHYEEIHSVAHTMKTGFMKVASKKYRRYRLYYEISKKVTS